MGAAESAARPSASSGSPFKLSKTTTQTTPLPLVTRDHPLHSLLHTTPSPPTDPETQFYQVLFSDYIAVIHSTTYPLTPLVTQALNAPTSAHAAALSLSLRAAIHHIRQIPDTMQIGALYFAHSVLSDLHRLAKSPINACLAIAAGPAEAELAVQDRMDLARSLRAHLVFATLDIIPEDIGEAFSPQILSSAIPLLLLALTDICELPTSQAFSPVLFTLSHYTGASRVVKALLHLVVRAAPYTRPAVHLVADIQPVSSSRIANSPDAVSLWETWDSFVASSAVNNLKAGFADLASTLTTVSQRLKSQKWPERHQESSNSPSHPKRVSSSRSYTSTDSNGSFKNDSELEPLGHTDNFTGRSRTISGRITCEETRRDSIAAQTHLAEEALALLSILCRPETNNSFAFTLYEMHDIEDSRADGAAVFSFSRLYDALGQWLAAPRAILVGYYLFVRNRRFRTFALARTDPDIVLAPLLASLRARCGLGAVSADAQITAAVLLVLTSDKGFCAAIDSITVPRHWLSLIADHVRLGGDTLTLSGAVLVVCARAVQQSLMVRRQRADVFLSSVCLAVMGNVASETTNIHSFVAERVVSLIDFLGRRRKRAIMVVTHQGKVPKEPPRVRDINTTDRKQSSEDMRTVSTDWNLTVQKTKGLVRLLTQLIGVSLEVVVCLLRARSTVATNRHLVYTLMHREVVLEGESVSGSSVKARTLMHMIGRMVHFFSELAEASQFNETNERHGSKRSGISVEKVFQVIEENSRSLGRDTFDGVPAVRFTFKEDQVTNKFLQEYAYRMLRRHRIGVENAINEALDDFNVFRVSQ